MWKFITICVILFVYCEYVNAVLPCKKVFEAKKKMVDSKGQSLFANGLVLEVQLEKEKKIRKSPTLEPIDVESLKNLGGEKGKYWTKVIENYITAIGKNSMVLYQCGSGYEAQTIVCGTNLYEVLCSRIKESIVTQAQGRYLKEYYNEDEDKSQVLPIGKYLQHLFDVVLWEPWDTKFENLKRRGSPWRFIVPGNTEKMIEQIKAENLVMFQENFLSFDTDYDRLSGDDEVDSSVYTSAVASKCKRGYSTEAIRRDVIQIVKDEVDVFQIPSRLQQTIDQYLTRMESCLGVSILKVELAKHLRNAALSITNDILSLNSAVASVISSKDLLLESAETALKAATEASHFLAAVPVIGIVASVLNLVGKIITSYMDHQANLKKRHEDVIQTRNVLEASRQLKRIVEMKFKIHHQLMNVLSYNIGSRSELQVAANLLWTQYRQTYLAKNGETTDDGFVTKLKAIRTNNDIIYVPLAVSEDALKEITKNGLSKQITKNTDTDDNIYAPKKEDQLLFLLMKAGYRYPIKRENNKLFLSKQKYNVFVDIDVNGEDIEWSSIQYPFYSNGECVTVKTESNIDTKHIAEEITKILKTLPEVLQTELKKDMVNREVLHYSRNVLTFCPFYREGYGKKIDNVLKQEEEAKKKAEEVTAKKAEDEAKKAEEAVQKKKG